MGLVDAYTDCCYIDLLNSDLHDKFIDMYKAYSNQRHLNFTVVHNCCKCERIFRTNNVTPLVSLEAGLRFRVIDLSQLYFWSGSNDQTAYIYIDLLFKPQLLQHRSPTSTELWSMNGESSRACASLGSKENHVQAVHIHSKYGNIGILMGTSEFSGEKHT